MVQKRLAVLGQPVAHSRSPVMQNAALESVGLGDEWSYEAIEVSAEELPRRLEGMEVDGFVGANVTIPHKEAALANAEAASAAALAIGAANTLTFTGGMIRADNTDAPALIEALPEPAARRQALVLGAGGAARAMIWALREAGAEVEVWNRTAQKAADLAAELGVAAVAADRPPFAEAEIIVNATSVGLEGSGDAGNRAGSGFKEWGLGADHISDRQVVVDLVYGATETELVRVAKDCGATTIDGLEILVRQGALSFSIWTGLAAPLAAMRRALQTR